MVIFQNFNNKSLKSRYLGFGPIYDVLHVDGIFALVFALLFVFLLEYPFFADTEAAS